tara:strand:- start:1324 stop:1968 length:645 start_codon:yes stop_codon:yes gene_type:complete
MKPYYQDNHCTIYHADCREILPDLPVVDLVLTDPPYGIGLNTNTKRFSGGSVESRKKRGLGRISKKIAGDNNPMDINFILDMKCKKIIFGYNCIQNMPRGAALVWVKRNSESYGSFLSDAEIAYYSTGYGVYCFKDLSLTKETNYRLHPTQKPLPLMQWCIKKSNTIGIILDPFMGSGTTLVAAKNLGRKAIGIELEEKYCEIAAKRLAQEVLF